jgi:serine/threonine protein phosphatase PrpC
MSGQTQLACATCGAPLNEGDLFCETCGARAAEPPAPAPGCRACGAGPDAIDPDGYCTVCGVRRRSASSHVELDLARAAAVSDQGLVHRRNEDAFHLELVDERTGAAVVCDGISSASASDAAARHASAAAGELLIAALKDSAGDEAHAGDVADFADVVAAMAEAIAAARVAVVQTPWTTRIDRDMPSCTLVSAAWRGRDVTIGWVGDSRAYWIAPGDARQLTVDESWAEEQIAEGRLSPEQVVGDRRFHSITNWVGADAPERPPRIATLTAEGAGRLILCSDGLWNYLSSPEELARIVSELSVDAAPAAIARSLTETALARGGHDNVTVAVVDIDGPSRRAQ